MDKRSPYILTINDFVSQHLNRRRAIRICLPPFYDATSSHRYPILYLHDGQNLFDPERSYAGVSWDTHQIVHQLIITDQIEEIILVAIDHGGAERLAEFAHHPGDFQGKPIAARGENYERFLIDELKPWIDRHFLTRTTADQTALMGSSMGGLVSLNIGLRHPHIFGKIAALSPSVWWQPEELGATLIRRQNALMQLKLWLDIGGQEGELGRLVPAFATRIKQLLGEHRKNFHYHFEPLADHSEAAWSARVHLPLRFLFGTDENQQLL